MFKDLDPLLHSQLRLAIMSLLLNMEEAEFTYLKQETGSTQGNLSVQLGKLKDAGYITIKKEFRNNYPLTTCSITQLGIQRFKDYADALQEYLKKEQATDQAPDPPLIKRKR